MIALTVHPEWAYAICQLGKRVENRTWRPPVRLIGRDLVIHAGVALAGGVARDAVASVDRVARMALVDRGDDPAAAPASLERILAEIRGCRRSAFVAVVRLASFDRHERGPWCVPGQWHWRLDSVRVLTDPLTASGRLGLWNLSEYQAEEVDRRLRSAVCVSPDRSPAGGV